MASTPVLKFSDISFAYADGRVILDGLNFELNKGEKIGLTGPNGIGKTTLFHLAVGLLNAASGRIEAFGQPLGCEKDFVNARRKIGLLFQDADDQLFCPTVLEDVAFGPLNLGFSPDQAKETARETLKLLGLEAFEERLTHRLSGGEKKLVSLATLMAMKPEVLLLDEPTNGLDERTRDNFQNILSELDISYIIISHDFDFLDRVTQKIYALSNGRINTGQQVSLHQHTHAHIHGDVPHQHE